MIGHLFVSHPEKTDAGPPVASFYAAETYVPGDSVGYLMKKIISGMAQQIDTALKPTGLTQAQWLPLYWVSEGKAATGAELARACHVDAGAMTRMLDRMEAKGLFRRERLNEDRRVVNLVLTPQGQVAAKAVPQALSDTQNAALAGFSYEEWQTLRSLLGRVLANVQNGLLNETDHEQDD